MTMTHDRNETRPGPGVGAAIAAFVVFMAIAAGAWCMASRQGGAGTETRILEAAVDEKPQVDAVAFLGGARHVVRSREFRKADAVAIFGECELDLTGAGLPPGGGRVDAFVLFGNLTLRVPRDWGVMRDDQVIFGKFENRLDRDRQQDPAKILRLDALVLMGGIEVTH